MPTFIDTNVLVYCTAGDTPAKRNRTRALVERLSAAGEAVVSTQVLIELFHVLTRKQKMPGAAAQALVLAYTAWQVVQSDAALVAASIEQSLRHRLSIWDAMVVQAALQAQARTLYSEDLGHGQRFGALAVVNPFIG